MGNNMSPPTRKRQTHAPKAVKVRRSPRKFGFSKKQNPNIQNSKPRRTKKSGFGAGSKNKHSAQPAALSAKTKVLHILRANSPPTTKNKNAKKKLHFMDKLTLGTGRNKHHQAAPTKKHLFGRRAYPMATTIAKGSLFGKRRD